MLLCATSELELVLRLLPPLHLQGLYLTPYDLSVLGEAVAEVAQLTARSVQLKMRSLKMARMPPAAPLSFRLPFSFPVVTARSIALVAFVCERVCAWRAAMLCACAILPFLRTQSPSCLRALAFRYFPALSPPNPPHYPTLSSPRTLPHSLAIASSILVVSRIGKSGMKQTIQALAAFQRRTHSSSPVV